MEHRWNKRIELSLDVIVRGRDDLLLHGRTRDISADGMFIRLTSQAVRTSTAVEIEVSHCGCLRGWVVHFGDEGIGVMFRTLNGREMRLLRQLLEENSLSGRK